MNQSETSIPSTRKPRGFLRRALKGCILAFVGLFVILFIIGLVVGEPPESTKTTSQQQTSSQAVTATTDEPTPSPATMIKDESLSASPQEPPKPSIPANALSVEDILRAYTDNDANARGQLKNMPLLVVSRISGARPGALFGAYLLSDAGSGRVAFDFDQGNVLDDIFENDVLLIKGKGAELNGIGEVVVGKAEIVDFVERAERNTGKLARTAETERIALYRKNILEKTELQMKENDPDFSTRFTIAITDGNRGSFFFRLSYSTAQRSASQVQADCVFVVRSCLRALVESGRKPADEWISVGATAMHPFKGETGKDMVQIYGTATYDFNKDAIEFELRK